MTKPAARVVWPAHVCGVAAVTPSPSAPSAPSAPPVWLGQVLSVQIKCPARRGEASGRGGDDSVRGL